MEYSSDSFKPLLKRLVETPEYFSSKDLQIALNHLFTPNTLLAEQIGAFLTALHINRVERRPESLTVAASILRERSLKAEVLEAENDFIVDIVGTGGDGHNLFNVSTAAAIVAAGAGARVIKVSRHPSVDFWLIVFTSMEVEHPPPLPVRLISFKPWTVCLSHHPLVPLCPSPEFRLLSFSLLITILH